MLTVRQIYQKDYPNGKKVFYKYTSEKYYNIHIDRNDNGWNFSLTEERFACPFVKEIQEEIFEPYKEGSEYYLAKLHDEEVAIMVVQQMEWNNTLLIHDLYVDDRYKKNGIGRILMEVAKKRATELCVRSIILETQTSNYPAIQFYLKNGFELIGFNSISYSNEDVKKNEVRIEMGYRLKDL
ncbi:GNAT family N-acetyltransferase [Sporosarcina thermotolerans]|uniref:GNAT family N-acetyltransferase n=1 Tax=Sporosarcina thermotolerans TaxID=633404 RepID=A0AAW9A5Y7_9BACL|nr:GNAT family N-acetyltransferase [Sporosarcina thermotolerans]MDW0116512.1 GNAT family N-acetyltransferase [Sporosarcina thermotolerans]WHT48740.1 GNAT family N-acetyltransferase [Sporosarcina thermotolerans]